MFFDVFTEKYLLGHPVSGFFSSMRIPNYPHFFEDCLKPASSSGYANYAGFTRGPSAGDSENPTLNDQEVEIGGDPYGDVVIPLHDFLNISLGLARKVLEETDVRNLLERELINNEWIESIQLCIPKIEAQLAALNIDNT